MFKKITWVQCIDYTCGTFKWWCPHCHKYVEEKTDICPGCGADMTVEQDKT